MVGKWKSFWDRPVADIVILVLTFTACLVIFLDVVFLILLAIFEPDKENISEHARNIGALINVLIGAIVGYLAGTLKAKGEKDNDESTPGR